MLKFLVNGDAYNKDKWPEYVYKLGHNAMLAWCIILFMHFGHRLSFGLQ